MDNFQQKATLEFSEELAPARSQSSSRKSVASKVLTVVGSCVGQSFGKPERDCVIEKFVSSINRTKETGVKICVCNRGVDAER